MKKQIKMLISIGVVLVVMVAAMVLLLRTPAPEDETATESSSVSQLLYEHEASSISTVKVTGGEKLTFSGDGAGSLSADGMKGLPVSATVLSSIAKYSASLTGQQPVEDGGDLEQFGLGAGAVKVEISYADGSAEAFSIGSEVPGASTASRYALYDGQVWVVYDTHVKNFLLSSIGLLDKEITPVFTDTSSGNALYEISSLTMTGAGREEPFIIKFQDTAEAAGYSFTNYSITSPEEWSFTYSDTGTELLDSPFELTAEEIVAYNVSEDDLAQYGLDEPYATVEVMSTRIADGVDCNFKLTASEAADGSIYLKRSGVDVIYKVSQPTEHSWYSASFTDYINDLLLMPSINAVSSVELETPDGSYSFTLNFETPAPSESQPDPQEELVSIDSASTHPEGQRSFEITDVGSFRQLYQIFISTGKESWADTVPSPEERVSVLRITYNYRDGGSDSVEFWQGPPRQLYVGLDGEPRFLTRSRGVEDILEAASAIQRGEEVKA